MKISAILIFLGLALLLLLGAFIISLAYFAIKALKKHTKPAPAGKAQAEKAKTLGEVLKKHRAGCKMTQEFVAEALGVSRQAVSKWESDRAAPSAANLTALAELFGTTPEAILGAARNAAE